MQCSNEHFMYTLCMHTYTKSYHRTSFTTSTCNINTWLLTLVDTADSVIQVLHVLLPHPMKGQISEALLYIVSFRADRQSINTFDRNSLSIFVLVRNTTWQCPTHVANTDSTQGIPSSKDQNSWLSTQVTGFVSWQNWEKLDINK